MKQRYWQEIRTRDVDLCFVDRKVFVNEPQLTERIKLRLRIIVQFTLSNVIAGSEIYVSQNDTFRCKGI